VIGFLSYGTSLVLFVIALRYLGTARTGAYFSIAPFLEPCWPLLSWESLHRLDCSLLAF
jgi:drug/metabolite transporter (DMT)-like permease